MTDLRADLERALSGTHTIERELGGGGMSRVFVATETALGRQVVVKIVPVEGGTGASERFRRDVDYRPQWRDVGGAGPLNAQHQRRREAPSAACRC